MKAHHIAKVRKLLDDIESGALDEAESPEEAAKETPADEKKEGKVSGGQDHFAVMAPEVDPSSDEAPGIEKGQSKEKRKSAIIALLKKKIGHKTAA